MTSPEAQKILTMLETADPMDAAVCAEIDVLTDLFIDRTDYVEVGNILPSNGGVNFYIRQDGHAFGGQNSHCPYRYTKSLDAIKAVEDAELEGWFFEVIPDMKNHKLSGKYRVFGMTNDKAYHHACPPLPTEQFARLYAVIMAIDFKRENECKT